MYFSYHNHDDYSNIRGLDSINTYQGLIDRAWELNLAGLAITDHECLSAHYKALDYFKTKKKKLLKQEGLTEEQKNKIENFKLALGNEIYLVRDGLNASTYVSKVDKMYHFILLAKDEIGHAQLRELSTRAWIRSFRQFVERVPTYYSDIVEIVGKDKGHLIASSACLGNFIAVTYDKFVKAKAEKDSEKMRQYHDEIMAHIKFCLDYFGDDFYIELQPSEQAEQIRYNNFAYELAKEMGIKVTVTTDSHYLRKEDRPIHKAYLNSAESEREVDSFYSSTYMMGADEIRTFFIEKNGFKNEEVDWIFANTLEIRDKITDYNLDHKPIVPKCKLPEIIPKATVTEQEKERFEYVKNYYESESPFDRYLLYLTVKGIEEKVPLNKREQYLERVNIELKELWEISEKLEDRMSAYLLIVRELIDIIWKDGDSLVGPARGSAMGFVINYLIDVTQITPLDKEIPLPHWRFINSERVSLPDVDVDTQGMKREQIVRALKNFYGEYRAINVGTFKTEQGKSAILTAMRGLGYDVDEARYVSSMIPVERGMQWSLQECYYGNAEKDRSPVSAFVQEMDAHPDVWEVAKNIEGLVCGRSSHAGGVIIVNEDFTKHNAIMRTPTGGICSQYELHDSESMGGIKFDLLSVNALDRIRVAMDLLCDYGYIKKKNTLKETYLSYFAPEKLDYESPDMWKMAYEGKVISLFQ